MPEIEKESAKKARRAGRFLPQAPRWRKHAVTRKRPRNGVEAIGTSAACGRFSWQTPPDPAPRLFRLPHEGCGAADS
jgi:hypothetical protein